MSGLPPVYIVSVARTPIGSFLGYVNAFLRPCPCPAMMAKRQPHDHDANYRSSLSSQNATQLGSTAIKGKRLVLPSRIGANCLQAPSSELVSSLRMSTRSSLVTFFLPGKLHLTPLQDSAFLAPRACPDCRALCLRSIRRRIHASNYSPVSVRALLANAPSALVSPRRRLPPR